MPETPPSSTGPHLVRAIGRWSLTALVVNSIIGSGVFGLPSVVAGYLGKFSPLAVLLAGIGMGVIFGCFAEVASHFHQAGGPYLYARAAFGRPSSGEARRSSATKAESPQAHAPHPPEQPHL